MGKRIRKLSSLLLASAICMQIGAAQLAQPATAADTQYLYGDLDFNNRLNGNDLVIMKNMLLGAQKMTYVQERAFDLSANGSSDLADVVLMQKYLMTEIKEFPSGTFFTVSESDDSDLGDFIYPGINDIDASLPTAGKANLVVFYVDFPDCRYSYAPSESEIDQITFGAADAGNSCYPFESISAFYGRASKGNMVFTGKTFRYTTKENQASYDTNKVKIVEECYNAFKDSVDFSQYDGDGDGLIDATLITVPTAAGEDNWWPCAGAFGDPSYRVDGVGVGHIITGNAQIESLTNYVWYTSSYCHELGHCAGLPDYYLGTQGNDWEGFHGTAGIELMDTDACSDFCAVDKLIFGFYREKQVQTYNTSMGTQTYTLYNAQTDQGNCVMIPYNVDNHLFGEYLILEYASLDGNNSNVHAVAWWQNLGSGVRVYHAETTKMSNYWGTFFKYCTGAGYSDNDNGRRVIRIVNDTETDNYFHAGDVISNSVSGFAWYDSNGKETVDPGITISVDSFSNDAYTITISPK